ncbi:undecaprenyl-phosphate glucose phosphotransferase, partial [Vibrio parahaemolyticus]|nr:undecaprenyl-phosphate glucose phosphotransferase [Vibrio parahaemolyticus]
DERSSDRLPSSEYPIKGAVNQALERAKRGEVDYVYIAMPMHAKERIASILNQFSDTTANTYLIPDFFTYNLLHSRWDQIGQVQTLSVFDTPFAGVSSWIKRFEDILFSSIILVLISPILLAIAIGIKLTSKGPVIFKQHRYGLDGRKIEVWKFRSMTTMDQGPNIKQATKNDPRITPFGGFLRRTSLDELPQFINVLQGTMSIVGPRPHAVAHNEEYRQIVARYMLRHKVKPGITGWAQINGYRGETDTLYKMEKRVEFDLDYIHHWSVWMDIKIIFLTVFKGFTGSNAY